MKLLNDGILHMDMDQNAVTQDDLQNLHLIIAIHDNLHVWTLVSHLLLHLYAANSESRFIQYG